MADSDLPTGTGVPLLDEAEWAVLSTGVLETDPPLVVEALTFTVPEYLQPLFEHLTATGAGDTNILAEFVAEASGLEFDSFSAIAVWDSAVPAEISAQIDGLLREFVGATGIVDGGELAAELAELRLPVFGSQPRSTEPLKQWATGAGNVGGALMAIGVLAGTHAPVFLVLTGPVGAGIALGTYATLGGIWATKRIRDRRAAKREADAAKAVTDPAKATAKADADADADAAKAKADADAVKAAADAEAARADMVARKQAWLRQMAQKRRFQVRPDRS
jgi:hypothetical protein